MWMAAMPSNEMTSGFKVAQERAYPVCQAERRGLLLVGESSWPMPRTYGDALGIQSRYAQTQMQAYALQAKELGRLIAEAAENVQSRS